MPFCESDVVQVTRPIRGDFGERIPAKAIGLIVDAYIQDDYYTVEFVERGKTIGLSLVSGKDLCLLRRNGKWCSREARDLAGA